MYKMHHPKSDIERLYLPRKIGGRRLIQLALTMKTATIGLDTYLRSSEDWLLKLVLKHEGTKASYSITKQAKDYLGELHIRQTPVRCNRNIWRKS